MTLREMHNKLWESLYPIDEPNRIIKAIVTYYIFVDLEEINPPITNFNDLYRETVKKLVRVVQSTVSKYRRGNNRKLKKERLKDEEERLLIIECLDDMIRAIQPHISPGN